MNKRQRKKFEKNQERTPAPWEKIKHKPTMICGGESMKSENMSVYLHQDYLYNSLPPRMIKLWP